MYIYMYICKFIFIYVNMCTHTIYISIYINRKTLTRRVCSMHTPHTYTFASSNLLPSIYTPVAEAAEGPRSKVSTR